LAELQDLGVRASYLRADVTDVEAVRAMFAAAEATVGPVDILVNNAGHNPLRPVLEIAPAQWDATLSLNLKAHFLCAQAALPGMVARRAGWIVGIGSISGQRGGLSADVDYSAAKAGILGFTRSLARWAAPRGVYVNAVAPGYIATELLMQTTTPERRQWLIDQTPLGRLGTPEDIGEAVAFLCSPAAAFIVGEVLSVNGGVHIA
jgi:NAD(P)-dependent dehydrogenase (short-subunit alcohol dehydrogenase family)